MNKITSIEELRSIQLDLLSFVHEFCISHNIRYSICGGTLIGAVRHGGYIPWDDDIDLLMLRDEYDRFISLFSKQESQYKVHTFDNTEGYFQPYAMVSDMRTKLEEPGLRASIGVNIDIFPIDNIPDEREEQERLVRKERHLYKRFVIKGLNWDNSRVCYKNMFMVAAKIVLVPFPRLSFSKKMDRIARDATKSDTNTRGCLVWGYGIKEVMPATVFEEYSDIRFEGRLFKTISDYDTYLRHLYGDYMQLPPKEKQRTHHVFHAYWK